MATDEKLKILEEKIKALDDKNADGNLMIKVSRKESGIPGGIMRPQIACTLAGGAISHVANPELWLPRLMGGGHFFLAAHAPDRSSVALVEGIEIILNGEERRIPDLDAPEDPTWKGPRQIIFPTKRPIQASPTVVASPPSTTTSNTGAPQVPLSGMDGSGGTHQNNELRRLIEEQRAYSAQLQQQLVEERRQRAEDQHKREMEILRTQQQQQVEAQRREMETLKDALKEIKNTPPPAPAKQGPSLTEMLRELTPLVLPVFSTWMTSNAERERRAEERQSAIMTAMQARPAIDPTIKEILDQKAANELPMATFMQQSAQTTAALLGQMTEMVKTMAEMNAGPDDSPAVKVLREVGGMIQGIASAGGPAPAAPRRLARQEGGGQPIVTPPPTQQPTAAMHGLNGVARPPGILLQLKARLLAKEDPQKVAADAVKAATAPEFQKALDEVGGEYLVLFSSLLGETWLAANMEYANAFGQAFTTLGQTTGLFEADGPSNTPEGEDGAEEAA